MKSATIEIIHKFRKARKWDEQELKDIAISLSLEASELLELFQWKTSDDAAENTERLKEELADVLIYAYALANQLKFDVDEITVEKLKKNALKYPIENV